MCHIYASLWAVEPLVVLHHRAEAHKLTRHPRHITSPHAVLLP
jgi:hypothetical protein